MRVYLIPAWIMELSKPLFILIILDASVRKSMPKHSSNKARGIRLHPNFYDT